MGWNSWNKFQCNVNETVIFNTIDRIVELGLYKVGYNYVNVDDCWASGRDDNGNILADPKTFPSGMKALADYAHKKGLLFGLYSDAGFQTCARRPGSLGYEYKDAATYASWGVDYLKYDNCNTDGTIPEERYPIMSKALLKQKRPIFFSLCEWGVDNPASWAAQIGNSWRTTGDISDNWNSMINNAIDTNWEWEKAGPGGWNDPDMLEVGNGGMNFEEYKIHMSLWCVMKAPLLIGCDLVNITPQTLSILNNTEAIAVNQDPLGKAGKLVKASSQYHIWTGPLSGGSYALVVYSLVEGRQDVQLDFLTLFDEDIMSVRDIWAYRDLGFYNRTFVVKSLGQHQSMFLKLTPRQ